MSWADDTERDPITQPTWSTGKYGATNLMARRYQRMGGTIKLPWILNPLWALIDWWNLYQWQERNPCIARVQRRARRKRLLDKWSRIFLYVAFFAFIFTVGWRLG